MIHQVTAKLGTMRKPQEFMVMTMTNGHIMIQSSKSIGEFNPATGKGRLSIKGNDFIALATRSTEYQFPEDFRTACLKTVATQGGKIDLGGVVVNTEITVI